MSVARPYTPLTMASSLADHIRAANETLLGEGDSAAVADFFAGSYVVHLASRDFRGHRFVAGFVTQLREAFPDLHVDLEILLEGDDRVAWRRTLRGAHEAPFQGFPPTGKQLVWQDVVVSRFEDGRIVEEWASTDLAEQLLMSRHAGVG